MDGRDAGTPARIFVLSFVYATLVRICWYTPSRGKELRLRTFQRDCSKTNQTDIFESKPKEGSRRIPGWASITRNHPIKPSSHTASPPISRTTRITWLAHCVINTSRIGTARTNRGCGDAPGSASGEAGWTTGGNGRVRESPDGPERVVQMILALELVITERSGGQDGLSRGVEGIDCFV